MKSEKLSWLADNLFYTKRYAFFVGRRCRSSTIRDVAKELHLDWRRVKEIDKQYMSKQLRRIGGHEACGPQLAFKILSGMLKIESHDL